MRRPHSRGSLLLALLALSFVPANSLSFASPRERRAVVFYTAQTQGTLEPCGCTSDPLGDIARAMGMTQIASRAGVTREALYKALSATGDPRLSTFLGVMNALGIKLIPRAA